MEKNFNIVVASIRGRDPRYQAGAYDFVRQGLEYTTKRMDASRLEGRRSRHISGQELCEGLREYALERYGVLAGALLQRWGLRRTDDFGIIVFLLVEAGVFGKTDEDSQDDFVGSYTFSEAFEEPFRPGIRLRKTAGVAD